MTTEKYKLIDSLLKDTETISYKDGNLDKILKRADMLVKKVFGNETEYAEKIKKIHFSPSITWSGMDNGIYFTSFESGKKQLINILNVMLEDINLSSKFGLTESTIINSKITSSVFLVHGHNEEMKQSSARFIEKIGLKPIILHEQPNRGRTIIEKFSYYSDVSFAIILLSADDIAFSKNDNVENAKLRARQNVILELGFFLGKIGRENVVVIHEEVSNLEIPSDYQGVIYVPYDKNGNWKLSIAKELKAVGFQVDGNKLLEN